MRLSTLLVWLAMCAVLPHCAQSVFTQSQKDAMLNAHNNARSIASPTPCTPLPAMTWNTVLANVAQAYADRCIYDHNKLRTEDANGAFGYVGENLYISTNTPSNPAVSVTPWDREKQDYDYATPACAPGKVCGHYTQIVWNSSQQLGCGAKLCDGATTINFPWSTSRYPKGYIVVCNYGPGGNFRNTKPYKACAQSTTEMPTTEVPTTEMPTTEMPTTEVPTTEVPTTEMPTTEMPTTEMPTTEMPTTEMPTTEMPTTEVPTTEMPTTEMPTTEVPTTEVPTTEVPTTEMPTTEMPTTEMPTTEMPTTEMPTTEMPTTEMPTTEMPTTEMPTTEVPTTEMPTTEMPTTEMPTTEVPTTEMPTTEMPTTEMPTTEMPTTQMPTSEMSATSITSQYPSPAATPSTPAAAEPQAADNSTGQFPGTMLSEHSAAQMLHPHASHCLIPSALIFLLYLIA